MQTGSFFSYLKFAFISLQSPWFFFAGGNLVLNSLLRLQLLKQSLLLRFSLYPDFCFAIKDDRSWSPLVDKDIKPWQPTQTVMHHIIECDFLIQMCLEKNTNWLITYFSFSLMTNCMYELLLEKEIYFLMCIVRLVIPLKDTNFAEKKHLSKCFLQWENVYLLFWNISEA